MKIKKIRRLLFLLSISTCFFCIAQPAFIFQTGHSGAVREMVFSNDGKFLASAGEDGTVIVWELKTSRQYATFQSNSSKAVPLCFHPTENLLAVNGGNNSVLFWNFVSGKIQDSISGFAVQPSSFAFDSTGSRLFVSAGDLSVFAYPSKQKLIINNENKFGRLIYNAATDHLLIQANPGGRAILQVRNASDLQEIRHTVCGERIYCVAGNKEEILYYNKRKTDLISAKPHNKKFSKINSIAENDYRFRVTALAASRTFLAMGNREKLVYVYEGADMKKKFVLGGHKKFPSAFAIAENHDILASADESGLILLWNLKTGKLLSAFRSYSSPVTDIAMSADNETACVLYRSGEIKKWNISDNTVSEIRFNPNDLIKRSSYFYMGKNIQTVSAGTVLFSCTVYRPGAFNKIRQEIFYNCTADFEKGTLKIEGAGSSKSGGTVGKYSFLVNENNPLQAKKITNQKYNFTLQLNSKGELSLLAHTGKLLNLTLVGERDFLFSDDSSYYWGSKGALQNVGFKYKGKLYDFTQFDAQYNRPDRIMHELGIADSALLFASGEAYKKRLKILEKNGQLNNAENAPDISVIQQAENVVQKSEYAFQLKAHSNGAKLAALFIYINGVPVGSHNGIKTSVTDLDTVLIVNLESGVNNIQCFVKDADGNTSLRENFSAIFENGIMKKPDLYIITIGSSKFEQKEFDLTYPAKDATDIILFFKKSSAAKNTYAKSFTDADVKRSCLAEIRKFLSQAKVEDQVVVFFAGHGVLDKNLDYYLSAYDIDFANPALNGISYDSLEQAVNSCASRKKIILLDACHSGEVDKEDIKVSTSSANSKGDGEVHFRAVGNKVESKNLYGSLSSIEISKMLFADTRINSGVNVISSAGAAEYAIEGAKWKNGVFTYSLLSALTNKAADLNGDNEIWVSELREFLSKKVSQLTEGKQRPTSRAENLYSNFRIW